MCSCIQAGKVIQGGRLRDSCHRSRNRLETCLKKQRKVDKNTCVVELHHKKSCIVRTCIDFSKNIRTHCSSMEQLKQLSQSMIKNKPNDLQPQFQTSATNPRAQRARKLLLLCHTAVRAPNSPSQGSGLSDQRRGWSLGGNTEYRIIHTQKNRGRSGSRCEFRHRFGQKTLLFLWLV